MKAFISGGAKNGKTTLGQDLAVYLAAGEKHYYVATMISADAEDDDRIRRHIADRAGLDFETIECPRHILSCLDTADRNGVFLLDSVTALLQNEIFPPRKTTRSISRRRSGARGSCWNLSARCEASCS